MRKMASLFASALVLGGVSVVSPVAWAHGDDLTVFAKVTHFEKTDNGREGPSEGDEYSFTADLFDEHWSDAGTSDGDCVLAEVEHEDGDLTADCTIAFDLDGGDIKAAGPVSDDDFHHQFTLPISEGTGDHQGAEGEVTIERLRRDDDHGHGHHGYHATQDDGPDGHEGHDRHDGDDHDDHDDHHGHGGDHIFKVTFDLHD